ncbi:MAG: ferrochelatase [Chlorobiales bacterium]|nr:ferrochelatase [Chlorobiales bacterium]
MKKRIAVIVTAHGEAESASFKEHYQVAKHTIEHAAQVMQIPKPLQAFVPIAAGLGNGIKWRREGYRSPHNQITREQAQLIGERLSKSYQIPGIEFDVKACFGASNPFIEDVLRETKCYDGQIIVSMTPIDSRLSCGLICYHVAQEYTPKDVAKIRVISRHWNDESLISLYKDHIFGERKQIQPLDKKRVLALVLHGTIVRNDKGGDPGFHAGLDETYSFAERMKAAVETDSRNHYGQVLIAYLNHDVGGQWTMPSFEETLESLQKQDIKELAVFPCGYFADGSETNGRAKTLLGAAKIRNVIYIDCINTTPTFIDLMAKRIALATQNLVNWQQLHSIIGVE